MSYGKEPSCNFGREGTGRKQVKSKSMIEKLSHNNKRGALSNLDFEEGPFRGMEGGILREINYEKRSGENRPSRRPPPHERPSAKSERKDGQPRDIGRDEKRAAAKKGSSPASIAKNAVVPFSPGKRKGVSANGTIPESPVGLKRGDLRRRQIGSEVSRSSGKGACRGEKRGLEERAEVSHCRPPGKTVVGSSAGKRGVMGA